MRITCQEQLLPGATLPAKWDAARRLGFDGIELRGQGGHRIRERLPELRAARRHGVVMNTVCVEMLHFIGDFDAERRRDATDNMRTQLSVIAEIGGSAAITPTVTARCCTTPSASWAGTPSGRGCGSCWSR